MRTVLAVLIGVALMGSAAAFAQEAPALLPEKKPDSITEPSPRALEGIDFRRAMELANAWGATIQSSLTTEGVTFVFPNGFRRLVATPPDRVLIAVAPYRDKTHPCATHTMSSCQGELVGVPVQVLASGPDGAVLIHDTLTTLPNGFLELYLPRDLDVRLSLRMGDLSVEGTVKTGRGSDTCITTLKLKADGAGPG